MPPRKRAKRPDHRPVITPKALAAALPAALRELPADTDAYHGYTESLIAVIHEVEAQGLQAVDLTPLAVAQQLGTDPASWYRHRFTGQP
ncbi:hypothetical protein WG915_04905 [Corynebacterium sp. H128]|uniref:hypothetical protein n=1 Tax=Corynebacterium sp. H128 TaxID=3133427 RepID=UPI0030A5B9CB